MLKIQGSDPDELQAVMAALVAGRPLQVMSDMRLVPLHRDPGYRIFAHAALNGVVVVEADEPSTTTAYAARLDRREFGGRRRRGIGH